MSNKDVPTARELENVLLYARCSDFPYVAPTCLVGDAMKLMSNLKIGCVCVVDSETHLVGVVTDGDLRRRLGMGNRSNEAFMGADIGQFISSLPITLSDKHTVGEALKLFLQHRVWDLPIIDRHKKLVGILHLQDLLKEMFR